MNSSPKPPTTNHLRGHPKEFEQIITEKSHSFFGRNFIFTAINEFIHRYHHGYFTIIGAPGSGKSAILAKYAIDHPHIVYYNVELTHKNRADEFLNNIYRQLLEMFPESLQNFLTTPPRGVGLYHCCFSKLVNNYNQIKS